MWRASRRQLARRSAKPGRKAGWGCSALLKRRKFPCSPGRSCNARDPIGIGQHRPSGRAGRAEHRAGVGSATPAPLTCSSLPRFRSTQAVRMRDVSATTAAEPRQPAWIGPARAPIGALPRSANDARTGRSRPNRKGALSPPRSYAQPLDVARKRVTLAGCRCRASGRVRPCWDQAFPCYSPLTGGHRGRRRHRAHRGSTRLQAGQLCLVQLCGGIRPRLGAMGMEHVVSAYHMVGVRMMVLWRHCCGRRRFGRRGRRDIISSRRLWTETPARGCARAIGG